MAVLLETTLGDIVVDLYPKERPRCCLNFLKLCKVKYYNFCLFHSVQRNFIAQTGDPTGSGNGGDSIFKQLYGDQARYFEMEENPRIKHKKLGAVAMVNNGAKMHGSQFFFTLAENVDSLDGVHTVFGEVSEGFDVLTKISESFTDKDHRPYQDIRINHTVILDDPFDDPDGLVVPDRSPEPTKDQLESGRIGADEDINKDKEKTEEQLMEERETKEAKANAQILEMVGDIPDADIKPPENVLFVCKLNPVTTSDDLQIIFSRFGQINSCEVIKDMKTEESLQYAFIEFERVEDCEQAYFKMDNVLIDDRRIHVDFSQSVAKLNQNQKFGGRFPNPSKEQRTSNQHRDSNQMQKQMTSSRNQGSSDSSGSSSPSSSSSSSEDDRHSKKRKKKKHRKKDDSSDSGEEFKRKEKKKMSKKDQEEREMSRRKRDKEFDHDRRKDREKGRNKDGKDHRKGERSPSHETHHKNDRESARHQKYERERSRSRDRHQKRDRERDRNKYNS
ncbi:peptidyl-prolyl cis-trans isomerase-like 4, partial [Anneissia japonica]|uniref:peptidyl-prolyl cis-trans isomerase-like 4 n=1 Tax=Anneissia japonica TaxID=1529436 RepID=UPI001425B85D